MSIWTFLFSSDNESWSVTKTCELSKAIGKVYVGMLNRFDTYDTYDASGQGSTDPYDQIGSWSYHKSLTQWMRILGLTDRYWDQLCLPVEKPRVLFPVCIEPVIEGIDITRVASWGPDRRKWLFSEVRGGIWTPHSPVLIKISADKRPLSQLTVKNLFFSIIIKTFCH